MNKFPKADDALEVLSYQGRDFPVSLPHDCPFGCSGGGVLGRIGLVDGFATIGGHCTQCGGGWTIEYQFVEARLFKGRDTVAIAAGEKDYS